MAGVLVTTLWLWLHALQSLGDTLCSLANSGVCMAVLNTALWMPDVGQDACRFSVGPAGRPTCCAARLCMAQVRGCMQLLRPMSCWSTYTCNSLQHVAAASLDIQGMVEEALRWQRYRHYSIPANSWMQETTYSASSRALGWTASTKTTSGTHQPGTKSPCSTYSRSNPASPQTKTTAIECT